jgi:transcription antitermination factor NusB
MRRRTLARKIALETLFQLDLRGVEVLQDLQEYISERTDDHAIRDFARELIIGCWQKRKEIDRLISGVSENWRIERMATVDRNVLRLAVYELLFREDIPPIVSINEAIDIAKLYGSEDSGAFVNGILDAIRQRYRKDGNRGTGSKTG